MSNTAGVVRFVYVIIMFIYLSKCVLLLVYNVVYNFYMFF